MNKKRPGGRKSWKVETLVRRIENPTSGTSYKRDREELRTRDATQVFEAAIRLRDAAYNAPDQELNEPDRNYDMYWKCVHELRVRGTWEVFQMAVPLCKSPEIRDRATGADLLAQLGVPERTFRREALDQLHQMLKIETEPGVISSVLLGIGSSQEPNDTRGIKRIAALRDHNSADVRDAVAMALGGRTDRLSVDTLIYLSQDEDFDVRDYATSGLGSYIDLDTPAIRTALMERLDDPEIELRCAAILGLANREDQRVKEALIQELNQVDLTTHIYDTAKVFEAAGVYGDKSLLPLLDRYISSFGDEAGGYLLKCARKAREKLADDG